MTLHIALVCNSYILQVGDRLLTTQTGNRVSEWDPLANKTLLLVTRNGIIAASYAGLAHINNMPTDEWMARAITGREPPEPFGDGLGYPMQFGEPMDLTTGGTVQAISKALEFDLPKQRVQLQDRRVEVLVTGWTWPRDIGRSNARPSTFAVSMAHSGRSGTTCDLIKHPRRRYRSQSTGWMFLSIGAGTRRQLSGLTEWMKSRPTRADEVEQKIVDTIREQGRVDNSTVGTNLVSTYLPIIGDEPRIRYFRDESTPPVDAFMPAVAMASGLISYPSIFSGGGTLRIGYGGTEESPAVIKIESVPPMAGPSAIRSQFRKRP